MIKVKDGYAKLIGTTYAGTANRVLLSNGSDFGLHTGRNNEANKIVRTDASGYIQAGWINTTSGDMGTAAINRIYCSNDGYIRYKTPANFFSTLANDSNQLSITVGSQNRKLTVAYATNSDAVDGAHLSTWYKHATAYPSGKSDKPWHKIATFSQSIKGEQINTSIAFYVSEFYAYKRYGIFTVRARAEANATSLSWLTVDFMVNAGIPTTDIVATWKNTGDYNIVINVYAYRSGWSSYSFRKIEEQHWGIEENTWVTLNAINGNENCYASIPSDENQITSVNINISNNAASATKLQTARNIWGQLFDGSNNVAGNMYDVGQITFSALTGTNGRSLLYQKMADNDYFRIYVGATASGSGYAEIATADDGTEPIYVRQYSGVFSTLKRTLVLLDGSGNSIFPGRIKVSNPIESSLNTATFLQGNKGYALISSTASAGAYVMLHRGNSTNGYFTIGTYQDKYLLQYTKSTTVTNDSNTVDKQLILLNEGGNSSFPGTVSVSGSINSNSTNGIQIPNNSSKVTKTSSNWIHGGVDSCSNSDANLRFGSWYGIGWYPTISGQTIAQGMNAMWLNVRTGVLQVANEVKSIKFTGTLVGNADSATKLTSNAGNRILPVYFSDGKPVACSFQYYYTFNNNNIPYIKLFTLKITRAYINTPITFNIKGRSGREAFIAIKFSNVDTTDPTITYFKGWGGYSGYYTRLRICKTDTSTWEIWKMSQVEGYDSGYIWDMQVPSGITFTWNNTTSSTEPTYTTYTNCTIETLSANISGNSATSDKWKTARSITLGNYLSGSTTLDGSSNVTLNATVKGLTSQGNKTAISGTTVPEDGLRMYQVYNNGYPCTFGNLISAKGAGSGELLLQWQGSNNPGHIFYRSKGDTTDSIWSNWVQILDSSNYSSILDNRYVTLTTDQSISSIKTFTKQQKFTVATGTSPFTVASTTKVTNLNSDMVDGYHISTAGTTKPWSTIVTIGSNGVSEMGRYIDFHYDNTTGSDYSTRLQCGGNHSNVVTLPSATGTLALTSQIPTVTNYYWANVKISSTSSTATTPIFATATATTSVTTPLVSSTGRLTLNATNTALDLKFNKDDTKSVILNGSAFKPFDAANNKLTLGSTTARWSNVYSVLGNFTGTITSSLTTGTYINGNKGTAIINSTAAAGYNMLAKMNSTNGVFNIGTYNTSFNLYYTIKTIIDAGTNSITYGATLLNESGNSSFPGQVSVNTLKITNTSAVAHLIFSRGNYNYVTAPSGGSIAFCVNGKAAGTGANCDLVVNNGAVHSGANNITTLGTTNFRWSNIYSELGNFSGDVISGTKFKASNTDGAISIYTSINRGLYDETNGAWVIYLLKDASHVYIPKWASKGSTTQPVYFNASGEPTPGTSYAKAIKAISRSGTTFTYTCLDGTTGTFTQQDNNSTYAVYGKTINASYKTAYRTQTKGNTTNGYYISAIRCDTASVSEAPQYGSGIAFGMSDTHGYLYMNYSSAYAYIGAGDADKLNWTATLLHSGNSSISGGGSSWGSSITVKINGTSKTLTIPANPNTDYQVKQSATTTSNFRAILLGTSSNTNNTVLDNSDTIGQAYLTEKLYYQPSSGTLFTTKVTASTYVSNTYSVLGYCGTAGDWTGGTTSSLVVGSSISTIIRSSGDDLYHYNWSAGARYKILDSYNSSVSGGGSSFGSSITVTINGISKTLTIPANSNTDTKVTNTLSNSTKFYITGTNSSSTNTGTQYFDSGVYVTTTSGQLFATSLFSKTLKLQGTSTGYTNIQCGTNDSSAYTLYLPGASGQIIYHTNDTAIGSGSKPIYITSGGQAVASSSTIGSSTKGIYMNSGTLTAMTYSLNATVNSGTTGTLAYYSSNTTIGEYLSTKGNSGTPIYISNGIPTVCQYSFLGGSSQPIILASGYTYWSYSSVWTTNIIGFASVTDTSIDSYGNLSITLSFGSKTPHIYGVFANATKISISTSDIKPSSTITLGSNNEDSFSYILADNANNSTSTSTSVIRFRAIAIRSSVDEGMLIQRNGWYSTTNNYNYGAVLAFKWIITGYLV